MAGNQISQSNPQPKPSSPVPPESSAPAERKPSGKRTFHVVGPGALSFRKQIYKEGTVLELNADEAKELGPLVAPGAAPKKVDPQDPGAGRYKLTASYWKGGKAIPVGTELELTAVEARLLAQHIERVADAE